MISMRCAIKPTSHHLIRTFRYQLGRSADYRGRNTWDRLNYDHFLGGGDVVFAPIKDGNLDSISGIEALASNVSGEYHVGSSH
jgi:hypothetical protein